tara:strand:- start:3090 stop:3236 length:147 start_codon:yes stop_codon:yes gene_type:complete
MWLAIKYIIPSIVTLPGQPGPEPGDLEIITELGVNMITEILGEELITE